jgi:hypothetical protein
MHINLLKQRHSLHISYMYFNFHLSIKTKWFITFWENLEISSGWKVNSANHDKMAHMSWLVLVCTGRMCRICSPQKAKGYKIMYLPSKMKSSNFSIMSILTSIWWPFNHMISRKPDPDIKSTIIAWLSLTNGCYLLYNVMHIIASSFKPNIYFHGFVLFWLGFESLHQHFFEVIWQFSAGGGSLKVVHQAWFQARVGVWVETYNKLAG